MKTYRKYLLTGAVVLITAVAVLYKFWEHATNPWTRNGQVQAEIIQITPRVSGPIVKLPVQDNHLVKAGELLFEIDPRTFETSLAEARAQHDITWNTHMAQQKQVEAARAQVEVAQAAVVQAKSAIKGIDAEIAKNEADFERQQGMLLEKATSEKAVQRAQANYEVSVENQNQAQAGLVQAQAGLKQAEASLAEAQANLGVIGDENPTLRKAKAAIRQAELNLEFTRVRAPVDGYITNLKLRRGGHAVANQPVLALVDIHSYWIYGFFKETAAGKIQKGDQATVTLMAYPDSPLDGYVESLGWGIAQQDGSTGSELLPNISPTFEWIRLAQRVPVRIHLNEVPAELKLRVGTTASVLVKTGSDPFRNQPEAGKKQSSKE